MCFYKDRPIGDNDIAESHADQLIPAPFTRRPISDQVQRTCVHVYITTFRFFSIRVRTCFAKNHTNIAIHTIILSATDTAHIHHRTTAWNSVAIDQNSRALAVGRPEVIPS